MLENTIDPNDNVSEATGTPVSCDSEGHTAIIDQHWADKFPKILPVLLGLHRVSRSTHATVQYGDTQHQERGENRP